MNAVKGFRDYSGNEAIKRAEIKKIIADIFESYGFEPAETPIIEYGEFVKGEKKQEKDEAISDIFKLKDKGNRKLALRYEFTFQLRRLMKNKKLPYKRYQIGKVFRDEPTKSNRFRQFTQCDVDIVGSNIKQEAEILALTKKVFDKLGIKIKININNRKLLNEILDNEKIRKKEEVIREIDKLNKLSEKEVKENLKKYKAGKILPILKKPESYFKKYKNYAEIQELKKYCKFYNINVEFNPSLARGLSYYNGSVFEIKTTNKKIKESLGGGGSFMFNSVQSTGISFGLERISELAKLKDVNKERILIISIGQDDKAIKLAEKLRDDKRNVGLMYGKPSKALEYANSRGVDKVIFLGELEVKKKKYKIKDMKTGKEKLINL